MAKVTGQRFDDLEDAELMHRMEHALRHMNRRDRRVFLMHRVDDLSYREIANACRISTDKVKQAMLRALIHMSKIWDDDYRLPVRKWWQFWQAH